ncbi:chorismate synthase [Candidatus Micrarchaeota archaeon]|nr:chorismate synthase [Candidatus Micrarchaeota archaeon]
MFKLAVFGESHGKCVGVVVDGCPAGLKVDERKIQGELDRRKPGQSKVATARSESDKLVVLSGVFEGRATGAPIAMLVWNEDAKSVDYEKMKNLPRPGHADFTAQEKYGGFNDYRGGGIFSGRVTAALVMAGALAKQVLESKGIIIAAHAKKIGSVETSREFSASEMARESEKNIVRSADASAAARMVREIEKAKSEGDSVGGVVECVAEGVPAGIGEPLFEKLDAEIAKALFSIPSVKGVEFGSVKEKGSGNNDEFVVKNGCVSCRTNNAGGVLAGISSGMPLKFTVKVKPTSSIARKQKTVNLKTLKQEELEVHGRHDACIVPRVIPVVEAATAVVLLDQLMQAQKIGRIIK